jgi:hypothetical protein
LAINPAKRQKLADPLEDQFSNGKYTDFVVQVGEESFRVHKNILSERSPVFATMVSNKYFVEAQTARLVIKDVSAGVIRELLKFVYNSSAPDISEEVVCDLYYAADKVTVFI